uniref:Uncharacterized protein n=1 Tax=Acrobeloides nanus TaxID=290746 RepID=A0A914EJZ0_9BILA
MLGEPESIEHEEMEISDREELETNEGCPKNFANILACLRLWNYFTKPDYEFIRNVLKECMVQRSIRETEPYDWENMEIN